LNEKEINDQILHHLQPRPASKRRGKFISFLRFFFKSRPSKEDFIQQGGVVHERVFGCDLGERLALSGRDTPLVLFFRRFRPLGYLISRYLIILKFYIYEVATAEYCNLPFELGFEWPPHLVTSYRANYIKDNFQQIRITDVF